MKNLGTYNLRFYLAGCCANGVNPLHPIANELIQHALVAAIVFTTQYEVDVGGE